MAARTSRRRFLAALAHGDKDHLEEATAKPSPEQVAALIRHMISNDRPVFDRCGWWWCRADAAVVPWDDLEAALTVLHKADIDACSLEVAQLANTFDVDGWAAELPGYVALDAALRALRVERDAERLRLKFLEELQPLLRNARDFSSPRGGVGAPEKPHVRATIHAAKAHGWEAAVVAAIMLLVGRETDVPFAKLKDRWRRRWGLADRIAAPAGVSSAAGGRNRAGSTN